MSESTKPLFAVTMGDPAGVGPEVIVGAWSDPQVHASVRPIVVGHPEILRRAARLRTSKLEVVEIDASSMGKVTCAPGVLPCVKACNDEMLKVPIGTVDARAGEAAYRSVLLAAKWANEKKVAGIVTAPLSKAALMRLATSIRVTRNCSQKFAV